MSDQIDNGAARPTSKPTSHIHNEEEPMTDLNDDAEHACSETALSAMFGRHAGPCHLAAGHEGMHVAASGARWRLTIPSPGETTETRLLRETNRVLAEVKAERDEWRRQNGLLRGELEAARAEVAELKALVGTKHGWRYCAYGPNNEIVFDPDVNDRWNMAELGGWRVERRPVYFGAWEPAPDLAEGNGDE